MNCKFDISVNKYEDTFIAYSKAFNLRGVSNTKDGALKALSSNLHADYKSLSSEKLEDLDKSAIKLLELYKLVFGIFGNA
ncbi:MAG: hypothetical protein KME47_09600 [Nodosilinea sp. WJT8-NPBG4]|jgi:hypothetical protein|nr:hypothetical protein [Nodosilinea sp. WJT8-NPBG4]